MRGGKKERPGAVVEELDQVTRAAHITAQCSDDLGQSSHLYFNVHGRVDIQVGTLSKAIGALGGYVCGSRDLIEFLYHRARPFLFSTSHPPSVAATCIAAFDVLEQEPERMQKLWENTRYWK